MRYMIVAGEASGDLHGAELIKSLKKYDTDAEIRFIGGDLMAGAACHNPDIHYDKLNVMGFSEVIRKLPTILRQLSSATRILDDFKPNALILIDFPDFNLKLAHEAKKRGVQVHYFISPKIWAWKEFRIKAIKKDVDAMYSILPFEVAYYRDKHNYKVSYVGNPSVHEMDEDMRKMYPLCHLLERNGISDERPIIALLPGSRKGEIRNNLPLMIEAAKRFPEFQYIVAAAQAMPERFYRQCAQDPGLNVVFGSTTALLKYASAALVTSGTATLETALMGTPQVVCYRANGSKLSYKIMQRLLKVKYVSLPNLIVNRKIVPELLLHECTAETIENNLSHLLYPSPERERQLSGYRAMRRRLGTDIATDNAAREIYEKLQANGREEK